MSLWEASKFDPANDPERPVVGDTIETGAGTLKIAEVEYVPAGTIIQEIRDKTPVDMRGHAELFIKDHPTRPFVKYKVWADPA
jgi:hypothetical protein